MKALFRTVIIVMLLVVFMGFGLFVKGAVEHIRRPLVSADTPGIHAAYGQAFSRASIDAPYAPV